MTEWADWTNLLCSIDNDIGDNFKGQSSEQRKW